MWDGVCSVGAGLCGKYVCGVWSGAQSGGLDVGAVGLEQMLGVLEKGREGCAVVGGGKKERVCSVGCWSGG